MGARIWLVSVEYGGATGGILRVASSFCSVVDDNGVARVFVSGVGALTVREEMPLPGQVGEPLTAAVELVGVAVDVRHRLARSRCEVALWEEGTTWERRRVVVLGQARRPTYAEDGAPVRFTVDATAPAAAIAIGLEQVNETSVYDWISARFVVTRTTAGMLPDPSWLVLDNDDNATIMPICIGYPGASVIDNGDNVNLPAFQPATATGLATVVYGPLAASQVGLRSQAAASGTSFTASDVTVTDDDSGRVISQLDVGILAVPLWGCMTPNIGNSGGGILRMEGDEAARDLFDVLRLLHMLAAVPLDDGALREIETALRAYMIDTVLEQPTALMDWVRAEVLSMLPLSAVPGPSGWRYLLHRPDAMAAEAVYHVDPDLDPNVSLAKPVEIEDDTYGSYALRYAIDMSTNDATLTVTAVGPSAATASMDGAVISVDIADETAPAWTHETAAIYDNATAALVVAQRAALFGRPRLRLAYLVPVDGAEHLRLGSIVVVSHDALALSGQVGQVVALEWSDDGMLGIEVVCYRATP